MTKINRAPSVVSPAPLNPGGPAKAPSTTAEPAVSRGWVKGAQAAPADTAASAAKLATQFYDAFSRRDAAAMEKAYDPGVSFHDPLFGQLHGSQVMDMWKTIMPAANPNTFRISPQLVGSPTARPDGAFEVKVHWDAHYDLGSRHVDNSSDTTLLVKNGKIISQRDDWDLSNWTRQAFPVGGGNPVANGLASFGAHSFIEVKSMLERGTLD